MSDQQRPASTITPLYELLTGDEHARACKEIPDEACREQPANFFLHLLSSVATKTADELASARLVLAWLLAAVGAPAFMTGLLVPIREAGALLPQLAVAGFLRRMAVRKWLWVAGNVVEGLSVIGMAAVAGALSGAAAGAWILALLVVFSLARGVASVAHKDVLGKTIDRKRRGTVMGYAGAVAGLTTLGTGLYVWTAGSVAQRETFFWLLLAAGVLWLTAAALFTSLREHRGATEGGANALGEALRSLRLLVNDSSFRHFVITRALLLATAFSLPFYVALAAERAGSSASGLGLMLIASGIAGSVSAPLWGRLADRSSRMTMSVGALIAGVLGGVVYTVDLVAPTLLAHTWLFAVLFFVLAAAHNGVRLGRKTYLVDLATPDTRASYVAVSNTLIGALLLLGGAFGVIAQVIGSIGVIAVLAVLTLIAAASAATLRETET